MDKEKLFREILQENNARIFRICCRYFTDQEEQNDAYQESLIRIWEQLHTFKGQSKISTWLYRVTVNSCLMHLRSDQRRKTIFDGGNPMEDIPFSGFSSDESPHLEEEKLSFFHHFLHTLNLTDRALVSLYLEEVSTREIAEITGLSEVNVRVRIYRIKNQIKKEWEEKQNGIG